MTSVYAFSYSDKEVEIVNKAKEIAKRNNQSFSKLVIEAITDYLNKEKNEWAALRCPILTSRPNNINTTLDKYIPNWILNYKDWQTQNKIQCELDIERQREVFIALNTTTKRWAIKLRNNE